MMRATAAAAASMFVYIARSVRVARGSGVNFSVASVTIASVPSEPIRRRVRS